MATTRSQAVHLFVGTVWTSRGGTRMAIAESPRHACAMWRERARRLGEEGRYRVPQVRKIRVEEITDAMGGRPTKPSDPTEREIASAAASGYLFELVG